MYLRFVEPTSFKDKSVSFSSGLLGDPVGLLPSSDRQCAGPFRRPSQSCFAGAEASVIREWIAKTTNPYSSLPVPPEAVRGKRSIRQILALLLVDLD